MLSLCILCGFALFSDAIWSLYRLLLIRDDIHTTHLVSSHPQVFILAISASTLELFMGLATIAVGFLLKKGVNRLFCTLVGALLCLYSPLYAVLGVPILLCLPSVKWGRNTPSKHK
jgi:hypothetical protein